MVLLLVESQLDAMSANEKAYYRAIGRRIAQRRNELGLTQVQMAAELRIPQQTYGSYEVGRHAFPLALLPKLARLLQTDIGSLLGEGGKPRPSAKRGPAPKYQHHMERISQLPRAKQRFVIQLLETALAQQGA